jgi:hypothetical protein
MSNQNPVHSRSASDALADERRITAKLRSDLEAATKALEAAIARAEKAELDLRAITDELRKSSGQGAILDLGQGSAQLRESCTLNSGLGSGEDDGTIRPMRGDILCAGDEQVRAALQTRVGTRSQVYRVTAAVLKLATDEKLTEVA